MAQTIELIKQPKPIYHTCEALPNLTLVVGMDIKKTLTGTAIGKAPGTCK